MNIHHIPDSKRNRLEKWNQCSTYTHTCRAHKSLLDLIYFTIEKIVKRDGFNKFLCADTFKSTTNSSKHPTNQSIPSYISLCVCRTFDYYLITSLNKLYRIAGRKYNTNGIKYNASAVPTDKSIIQRRRIGLGTGTRIYGLAGQNCTAAEWCRTGLRLKYVLGTMVW